MFDPHYFFAHLPTPRYVIARYEVYTTCRQFVTEACIMREGANQCVLAAINSYLAAENASQAIPELPVASNSMSHGLRMFLVAGMPVVFCGKWW